jgi:L-asparaginase
VDIIKVAAGADGRFIDFARESDARGLVIEGLGRGNVTVATLPAIERALEAKIPVVITSRCPRGRVLDTYAYEGAGRQLKRMGVILGGLVPSHKARIKLMLLLGAGYASTKSELRLRIELGVLELPCFAHVGTMKLRSHKPMVAKSNDE